MEIRFHESLDELDPAAWNTLAGADDPFLRYEFLAALERHDCVGETLGWLPRHIAAYDSLGTLLGAVPMYLKTNSYGELVFDWAWADAYRRHGLAYYPKLVAAIPYTPATGKRLLTDNRGGDGAAIAAALIRAAIGHARDLGLSSVHFLFPDDTDICRLQEHGLLRRTGCQYHWSNCGYASFEHFLQSLTASKRKKIKRERRRVRDAGIEIRTHRGEEVSTTEWETFHELYCSTFQRLSGIPTLTLAFFHELAKTMGEHVLLTLARFRGEIIAGAFSMRGTHTLYGRHWGCFQQFNSLHFETCYYTGLEYCIEHGLRKFDPGAQGEHKVSRGFLPVKTWSAHWLADSRFHSAIERYLQQETEGMNHYLRELGEHSPYKSVCDQQT